MTLQEIAKEVMAGERRAFRRPCHLEREDSTAFYFAYSAEVNGIVQHGNENLVPTITSLESMAADDWEFCE